MSLSLEWTKHLKDERKREEFESVIRNSTMMAQRLLNLCDEWEAELNSAEIKISDYDTPNWALRQAHRLGDRSRIKRLRDLLASIK